MQCNECNAMNALQRMKFDECNAIKWLSFYFHFSKTNQLSFVLVINRKNTLVFVCFVFDHSKTNPVSFVLVINKKNS